MALWLSNIPVLLKSLRDNDWYITAFPFSFNSHEYVVIFEDLRELNKQIPYFSVCLTFVDLHDATHTLETYANSFTFEKAASEIFDFFAVSIDNNASNNSLMWTICDKLNKSVPEDINIYQKEYEDLLLEKIEQRTNNEGMCCYDVRHNGKSQNGIQKERSLINTSKTKLLRPTLFNLFKNDKTISFFYRKANELSDEEILKNVSARQSFYSSPDRR